VKLKITGHYDLGQPWYADNQVA